MYYLVAAVVVAQALTVLNLVLAVGVIRRLRALDARPACGPATDTGLPAGARAPDLTATTVAGDVVSTVDHGRVTLVGFFSPDCGPCPERIPQFVAHTGARVATVAVVVTDADDSDASVRRLAAVDVVVEPGDGPWRRGFAVTSFPTLCLVDTDGVVLASGTSFSDLPAFATA